MRFEKKFCFSILKNKVKSRNICNNFTDKFLKFRPAFIVTPSKFLIHGTFIYSRVPPEMKVAHMYKRDRFVHMTPRFLFMRYHLFLHHIPSKQAS